MRRLLAVPVVVVPVAAASAVLWVSGMVWPIATTAASVLLGRRPGPNDEEDLIG